MQPHAIEPDLRLAERLFDRLRTTSLDPPGVTRDAYGQGPVQRRITSMRGNIRSGNSGGPVVDANGQVVATVFAATIRGPKGGFGVPTGIVQSDLTAARRAVDNGPCAP